MLLRFTTAVISMLLLSGCFASLVPKRVVTVGKSSILVGNEAVKQEWKCKKVGGGGYMSNASAVFGVYIGDNVQVVTQKAGDKFAKETAKAGGNYVDMDFVRGANAASAYDTIPPVNAKYYNCKKLPE